MNVDDTPGDRPTGTHEAWRTTETRSLADEDGFPEDRLAEAIVDAVSSVTNTRVRTLDPLASAVDPEALSALFQPTPRDGRRRNGRVEFTYAGCRVTLEGTDSIEVRLLDRRSPNGGRPLD